MFTYKFSFRQLYFIFILSIYSLHVLARLLLLLRGLQGLFLTICALVALCHVAPTFMSCISKKTSQHTSQPTAVYANVYVREPTDSPAAAQDLLLASFAITASAPSTEYFKWRCLSISWIEIIRSSRPSGGYLAQWALLHLQPILKLSWIWAIIFILFIFLLIF